MECWGQQLSCLSRAEEGFFRFARENSSHTFGLTTTIAIESRLPYASVQTGSILCCHGVPLFTIALRIVSSFRMQAVSASFFAFPA